MKGKQLDLESHLQLRANKSLPILDALHDWLIQTRAQTANGSAFPTWPNTRIDKLPLLAPEFIEPLKQN